jgi:hypothetical protein
VPNSGLPNVGFFSALATPTVAGFPTVTFPYFNVTVVVPTTGRVTFIDLFYTTTATPAATDWKLLTSATSANAEPFASSSSFVFSNQSLPTGTYYFGYIVGNEISQSTISPLSASFAWNPTGQIGPVGQTGGTGPRNAQVFFYYNTEQAAAPAAPTTAQIAYNFTTQVATITTPGWSALFNPSAPEATTANNKYWAVKVAFQETTFGGAYTETISAVFTWQNLDGLVTFTNLATATGPLGTGVTFIDGGSITANSLTVDKITSGQTTAINGGYFGLGVGTLYGYTGVGRFDMQSGTRTALACTYSNATGDGLASLFITRSPNSWGTSAYYATTNNYNAFATTAVTGGNIAGLFKYNQSITTPDNIDLPPRTITLLGGTDWATYAEYLGATGTFAKYQGILAYLNTGGLFTYFTASNVANKQILLANVDYAAFTPTISGNNKIYCTDGYLPFTGVHDGLYEGDIEIGDILVDYLVVKKLDVSSVIMQYQKSSSANQKGAIGACSYIYDVPPLDWDEYFVEQGPVNLTNGSSTQITVPNPQYVPIPAGQRVVNVNSVGEGLINVCGEGGDLDIGDLIVTSSTPGKGMKQSDDIVRSITVAKSREAVTFSSPTEVKQIACIYLGG